MSFLLPPTLLNLPPLFWCVFKKESSESVKTILLSLHQEPCWDRYDESIFSLPYCWYQPVPVLNWPRACRFLAKIHGFSFFCSKRHSGSTDLHCEQMKPRPKSPLGHSDTLASHKVFIRSALRLFHPALHQPILNNPVQMMKRDTKYPNKHVFVLLHQK